MQQRSRWLLTMAVTPVLQQPLAIWTYQKILCATGWSSGRRRRLTLRHQNADENNFWLPNRSVSYLHFQTIDVTGKWSPGRSSSFAPATGCNCGNHKIVRHNCTRDCGPHTPDSSGEEWWSPTVFSHVGFQGFTSYELGTPGRFLHLQTLNNSV